MKILASAFAFVWLILLAATARAAEPDGTFSLSTRRDADGMLVPILTWDIDADSCVASGDPDWSGPKPASGQEELSPRSPSQPRSFALLCSTVEDTRALLTWVPPTQNTDGTALTDLAGFTVQWGESPNSLSSTVRIDNASTTTYQVSGLEPNKTYHFGVRAFNALGAESELSNIVSKTTTAGAEWGAQTYIRVPRPPQASAE